MKKEFSHSSYVDTQFTDQIVEEEALMKTYILEASVEQEDDGRWSAWVEALPGCATWGYTQEEALETLKEAARLYTEDDLRRLGLLK
jgi:predicted RNase H-like HicB family nuclease